MNISYCGSSQQEKNWVDFENHILIDELPCGVCQLNHDDCLSIGYANPSFYRIFGVFSEDVGQKRADGRFSKSMADLLPDNDCRRIHQIFGDHNQTDSETFDFELSLDRQSEGIGWLLFQCSYCEEDHSFLCAVMDITQRKKQEEELRIQEEINRVILAHENIFMGLYHIPNRTLHTPPDIAYYFGIPMELKNWPYDMDRYNLIEENREVYLKFYDDILSGKPSGKMIVKLKDRKGQFCWLRGVYTRIDDPVGNPLYAAISYKNITLQREKELVFEKWKQMYHSQKKENVAYYEANLSDDIFEDVEGDISELVPDEIRKSYTKTIEYMATHLIYEGDRFGYLDAFSRESLLRKYQQGERLVRLEYQRLGLMGEPFWASSELQMFADPYCEKVKCFILVRNIDQDKQLFLNLETRSQIDQLTNVYNRATIIEQINRIFCDMPHCYHGLVMLDIDYFKRLNDTRGHLFGDKALREMSALLKKSLNIGDVVGRIGGDEFMICLKDISCPELLKHRLETLYICLHKEYPDGTVISGSLGAALYPIDGRFYEELYEKADIALYQAKRMGRNRYVIYQE